MTLKDRTEQESHSLISSSHCSALVSLLPTLLRRPLGEKLTVLKSSAFSRITDLSTPYCLPISDSTDLVSLLFTNLHQEQAVIGQEKQFIRRFSGLLKYVSRVESSSLFHLVGQEALLPQASDLMNRYRLSYSKYDSYFLNTN